MIDAIQAISVILILGITILIAKLIAPYITRVYNRTPSRLDKVLNPVENFIYKICSIRSRAFDGLETVLSCWLAA